MTYTTREQSSYLGQPIELYEFSRFGTYWRYTSSDEDKLVNGTVYTAIVADRSAFEQTQEMSRNPISVTMDKDVPFLIQFRGSPPSDPIQLTIKRYHEGDTDIMTVWVGRVVNVKFKEREADIRCEPIFTALKRPVLRRRYQTTCPHVLYGIQCGVSTATVMVPATLSAVSGKTLTSGTIGLYANGHFAGGYVDWLVNSVIERRFIIDHTGSTITTNLPFSGMTANAQIEIYPGCDHLLTTCDSKYNNVDNYGGQPFYPSKNPLGGALVF